MYVYVQGRRLPRQSASRKTPRLEDAHDLISKSLALCDGAQKKLDGFEDALPGVAQIRALNHPPKSECRPLTARASDSVRAYPFRERVLPGRAARPWTSTRQCSVKSPEGSADMPGTCRYRKGDEVECALRERNLLKQVELLEQKVRWLDEKLSNERNEKRKLDQKLKSVESVARCNAMPTHATSPAVRRRYHFAVESDGLNSTLASCGSSSLHDMSYFEVVVDRGSRATSNITPEESAERTRRYTRFSYSDRPYEVFAGENDEARFAAADGVRNATKILDSMQVSAWLDQTAPRSAADAVPLFILAKDLLRRLVSREITWDRSRVAQLESKVAKLEDELGDARYTIQEYEVIKREEMLIQRRAHEKEIADAKAEFQARFRGCVKKLTPLALKNGMLQSRVKGYQMRWREALNESPAQVSDAGASDAVVPP